MSTTPPEDLARITDYVAEELSPEEMAETERWIQEDEGRKELVEYLRRSQKAHLETLAAESDVEEVIHGLTTVLAQRSAVARIPSFSLPGHPSSRGWTLQRRVGYALLVSAFAVLVVNSVTHVLSHPDRDSIPAHTYTTAVGQQASIPLTNGARVLLGPATTLTVNAPSSGVVGVRVHGEALFMVKHVPTQSFRIQVGQTVTRILGTTFLVRRYATDAVTRIVVAEGRVSVSGMPDHGNNKHGSTSTAILTARMLGTVNDSGAVQVTPNIVVEDYTGWATGQLVFRKTLARDVAVELGRAYGVDIRIADSVHAVQPISWTVALAQQSLTSVLESLAAALDAHPVRAGRVITLVPGRSPGQRSIDRSSSTHSESQYGK